LTFGVQSTATEKCNGNEAASIEQSGRASSAPRNVQRGVILAVKRNRDLERRIDGFYAVCEKILLRTLIFGCFVLELGRFARWLWR
jgi:hypothetical protein